MAKKREPIDFGLPGIDDIFSTQAERDEAKLKKIYEIPLDQIDPFPEHPFKVKDDEDMMNLVESVKANGIITPATLRKKEDGRYEIISGHRRKRACELAGLETLRSEVVDMTRDEATIFMVESNFQRINMNVCSVGTLNSSMVSPREVFKSSILSNAAAFIAIHNHPSGTPIASAEDREVTGRLAECGRMLDIKMVDHIIVAGESGQMMSFKAEGILDDHTSSKMSSHY
jgi:proteasome lid subunit RPN8/RPN11